VEFERTRTAFRHQQHELEEKGLDVDALRQTIARLQKEKAHLQSELDDGTFILTCTQSLRGGARIQNECVHDLRVLVLVLQRMISSAISKLRGALPLAVGSRAILRR
jgi:hypothetical protein